MTIAAARVLAAALLIKARHCISSVVGSCSHVMPTLACAMAGICGCGLFIFVLFS